MPNLQHQTSSAIGMIAPFDIFKTDAEGLLWLGTAETLEEAKARVQYLGQSEPGEYIVVSERTGNRIHINVERRPNHLKG